MASKPVEIPAHLHAIYCYVNFFYIFTIQSLISKTWQEQFSDLEALLESESFQAMPIRIP